MAIVYARVWLVGWFVGGVNAMPNCFVRVGCSRLILTFVLPALFSLTVLPPALPLWYGLTTTMLGASISWNLLILGGLVNR